MQMKSPDYFKPMDQELDMTDEQLKEFGEKVIRLLEPEQSKDHSDRVMVSVGENFPKQSKRAIGLARVVIRLLGEAKNGDKEPGQWFHD